MLEVPGPYGEDCPALCPETPLSVPVEHPEATSGPLLAGWSPNVESIALWTAPGNGATLGVVSPRGGGITPIAGTLVRRSWVQWSRNGDRLLVVEGTAREAGAPPSAPAVHERDGLPAHRRRRRSGRRPGVVALRRDGLRPYRSP